ncbi:hypothetical protein ILUMI_06857, partial [Ignelater luminosus]
MDVTSENGGVKQLEIAEGSSSQYVVTMNEAWFYLDNSNGMLHETGEQIPELYVCPKRERS